MKKCKKIRYLIINEKIKVNKKFLKEREKI